MERAQEPILKERAFGLTNSEGNHGEEQQFNVLIFFLGGTVQHILKIRRTTRGSSFIKVLLAMTIMALVLVGILQMFSVSLVINKGSAARTQMLFKCQQVVGASVSSTTSRGRARRRRRGSPETGHASGTAMSTPGALPDVLGDVSKSFLPYNQAESAASWAYWGPAEHDVMDGERPLQDLVHGPPRRSAESMWTKRLPEHVGHHRFGDADGRRDRDAVLRRRPQERQESGQVAQFPVIAAASR